MVSKVLVFRIFSCYPVAAIGTLWGKRVAMQAKTVIDLMIGLALALGMPPPILALGG
jgi:hypothetical protein